MARPQQLDIQKILAEDFASKARGAECQLPNWRSAANE